MVCCKFICRYVDAHLKEVFLSPSQASCDENMRVFDKEPRGSLRLYNLQDEALKYFAEDGRYFIEITAAKD